MTKLMKTLIAVTAGGFAVLVVTISSAGDTSNTDDTGGGLLGVGGLVQRSDEPSDEEADANITTGDFEVAQKTLRDRTDAFDDLSDDKLREIGIANCDALDEMSVDELFSIGVDTWIGEEMDELLFYSTLTHCPRHMNAVAEWVR